MSDKLSPRGRLGALCVPCVAYWLVALIAEVSIGASVGAQSPGSVNCLREVRCTACELCGFDVSRDCGNGLECHSEVKANEQGMKVVAAARGYRTWQDNDTPYRHCDVREVVCNAASPTGCAYTGIVFNRDCPEQHGTGGPCPVAIE